MILDGLDLSAVTKLLLSQVELATCLECCKYYIAPETASCGHTLCHGCWSGRRSCPTCAAPLDRKALKLNLLLQSLTEHIHELGDTFEKVFKVKLEEFDLDIPDKMTSSDPSKHVKDWLASSQNHFSAPVLSSQQSTQDIPVPVELSGSKIQIHTHTKKTQSPVRVVQAPLPQEDWDKIEVLPDTEGYNTKNKENVVGPMDIEPFFIDDEYTTDHPRRSSRNREVRPDLIPRKRDASTDKHSSKNSSTDTEKHLLKTKQTWNSVKKMRKEFSKLGKRNKSKLNVSIEMCKKAQSKSKVQVPPKTPPEVTEPAINDDTPDITKYTTEATKVSNKENVSANLNLSNKKTVDEGQMEIDSADTNKSSTKSKRSGKLQVLDCEEVDKGDDSNKADENTAAPDLLIHKQCTHRPESCNNTEGGTIMPFIKRGNLHQSSAKANNVEITQIESQSNTVTANTDDIEISIKIGSTVTNIVIKQKQRDVQLKLCTDQQVQTSLGPHSITGHNDVACSPVREIAVQNIELNVVDGNKVEVSKSFSTKKHTASADTATAQFEITDSVERELSNVMECIVAGSSRKSQKTPLKTATPISAKSRNAPEPKVIEEENQADIPEDREDDDFDLFGSVKQMETNTQLKENTVKLLKDTKHVVSDILVTNVKTQKITDKRNRDVIDETEEMPLAKKLKMDEDKLDTQKSSKQPIISEDHVDTAPEVQDSEPMNYDAILGQAFANIDADIRSSQKNVGKNIPIAEVDSNSSKPNTELSQIIHKTIVTQKNMPISKDHNNSGAELINEKYSENMFSMLEKDSEPQETTGKNDEVPEKVATQKHIEEILTPGVCRDLAASAAREDVEGSQSEPVELDLLEPDLGTPVVAHDDDVVEETPQKNISFTKPKQTSTSSNVFAKPSQKDLGVQMLSQAGKQMTDSQIIKSIINISDTMEEPIETNKDTTILTKKSVGTPLTINKFVNQIKHNSTPVARKSLNFDENTEDPEQTLCPTTTQEKEFMEKAFEPSQITPKRPVTLKSPQMKKLCIAGSCLTPDELATLKRLCRERGWTFSDKYTDQLTHLVVGVDKENRSQRSVKYMCALAASKFIVSFRWVYHCLQKNDHVDEFDYEAVDASGEPGPRRSRLSTKKLFEGFTFYCMTPFTILDLNTLTTMLQSAGAKVVQHITAITIAHDKDIEPKILLAEPKDTQDDRFVYIAIQHKVVPVNYEWALNCLGAYTVCSIRDLLLCPPGLLPPSTASWPYPLIAREVYDDLETSVTPT